LLGAQSIEQDNNMYCWVGSLQRFKNYYFPIIARCTP
jgi:hypothetical protein